MKIIVASIFALCLLCAGAANTASAAVHAGSHPQHHRHCVSWSHHGVHRFCRHWSN